VVWRGTGYGFDVTFEDGGGKMAVTKNSTKKKEDRKEGRTRKWGWEWILAPLSVAETLGSPGKSVGDVSEMGRHKLLLLKGVGVAIDVGVGCAVGCVLHGCSF
jgi:hypothetical protein